GEVVAIPECRPWNHDQHESDLEEEGHEHQALHGWPLPGCARASCSMRTLTSRYPPASASRSTRIASARADSPNRSSVSASSYNTANPSSLVAAGPSAACSSHSTAASSSPRPMCSLPSSAAALARVWEA